MKLILLLALLILSCSQEKFEKNESEKPVYVKTQKVYKEKIKIYYTTIGYIEAENEVEIRPEVSGIVRKIYAEEGKKVKKGEKLLKIDDRTFVESLKELKAQLRKALAEYENQKKVVKRREFLFKKNLISKEEYDIALTRLKVLEEEINSLKARIREIELNISKTMLRAPFEGYISKRYVNEGDYVSPQTKVFKIVSLNPLRVVFKVPQEIEKNLKLGMKVKFEVEGKGSFFGKIFYISPEADKERMIMVKARFKNSKETLKPNMYALVEVPIKEDFVFKVPERSVALAGNKKIVWKIKKGVARSVEVKILKKEDGFLYVKGDLQNGDKIAVENVYLLRDGVKVRER